MFWCTQLHIQSRNGHYLKVVSPLDHLSFDSNRFGEAVSQRVAKGGSWLTWVVTVDGISKIKKHLGRAVIDVTVKS